MKGTLHPEIPKIFFFLLPVVLFIHLAMSIEMSTNGASEVSGGQHILT